jgi:hypothetical protein
LDSYIEEYRARGICQESVAATESRLQRWGHWLKKRRPRVAIEQIGAELISQYIASCASFRSKATVYGTLSTMRGFGDFLVRQGLWRISPLCWMKPHLLDPPTSADSTCIEASLVVFSTSELSTRHFVSARNMGSPFTSISTHLETSSWFQDGQTVLVGGLETPGKVRDFRMLDLHSESQEVGSKVASVRLMHFLIEDHCKEPGTGSGQQDVVRCCSIQHGSRKYPQVPASRRRGRAAQMSKFSVSQR